MKDNVLCGEDAEMFFKALLTLKSVDECRDFFEDVCTVQELKSISQRFVVAKMLDEQKVYSEIVAATGASTATVSRVKRSLYNGNGSFKRAFERLER